MKVAASELVNPSVPGKITKAGVRENVVVILAYTAAWIGGNGCIPLNFMMEDAATAEIARVQLWQWVKYGARQDDGEPLTVAYVDKLIDEFSPKTKTVAPGVTDKNVQIAADYTKGQIRKQWPSEFLTSDLMIHLAVADGAPAKFQRSAL